MKILYLTHRIPYPPDKGDKIRSYHLLAHLARRGAVDLITHVDDPRDLRHEQILRDCCRRVEIQPINRGLGYLKALGSLPRPSRPLSVAFLERRALRERTHELLATEDYDCVVAFSSQVATYLPEKIPCAFIMDMVDVDSEKFAQYARTAPFPKRWIHKVESRRLRKLEQAIGRQADRVVLTTPHEVDLYNRMIGTGKPVSIVNGVTPPDVVRSQEDRSGDLAVFLGQMDYPPNVEAVTYVAREVWPLVRLQYPNARFRIVGRNPTPAVKDLAGNRGIDVTGTVPDLRVHLEAAALSLIPLRLARGIQNKVLESMAHGVPVVTTEAVRATLHPDADGAILASNTKEGLAEAVCKLFRDDLARRDLGTAGRKFVRRHHDWGLFDDAWDRLFEEVKEERRHPGRSPNGIGVS